MKRVLLMVICLATIFCLMACSAGGEKEDPTVSVADAEVPGVTTFPLTSSQGLEYEINSDIFTCTVTGIGDCPDAYVAIGEQIDGYRVTAIADSAFYCNTQVKGLSIGKYVTSIGEYAFFGCSNMETLELNGTLSEIGQYAFGSCGKLRELTIPETLRQVGAWAFYDCTSLNAVRITDLASWCAISFGGAYANPVQEAENLYLGEELLTSLVLPEGMTSIGDWAFTGCRSLEEVVFSNDLTQIGQRAFLDCRILTKFSYPGTVEEWKALQLGTNWDFRVEEYVIVCKDGEIKGK